MLWCCVLCCDYVYNIILYVILNKINNTSNNVWEGMGERRDNRRKKGRGDKPPFKILPATATPKTCSLAKGQNSFSKNCSLAKRHFHLELRGTARHVDPLPLSYTHKHATQIIQM
jgi:hypothetical protein